MPGRTEVSILFWEKRFFNEKNLLLAISYLRV
uniref:Uncharacterized protein n=1 Tax=Rhizophora mucronata TaxID=61149 RepID=A0A2P2Q1B1_RHIMU